ncbi:MAG: hypothetical protein AMJ88_12620 [Anaerolineae bacterium SM23_ 63]|nr:MAG: hypothetical protein AMJ88_12620 [Anaerolineae bacterium SM23_ 63]
MLQIEIQLLGSWISSLCIGLRQDRVPCPCPVGGEQEDRHFLKKHAIALNHRTPKKPIVGVRSKAFQQRDGYV